MTDETKSTSNGRGSGAKVIPLPQVPAKRTVADVHLANLRASGLTDDTIQLANLYTEDRPKALAELVQRRSWNRLQGSALVFPFYLPGAESPHACRLRPTTPLMDVNGHGKKRARKYDQASSAGLLVYFAPRARAAGLYSATGELYWTEGEKKTLTLDQEGLACVGLTGVWNWLDVAHKDKGGGERLHPHIVEHVTVGGRPHVIVFDADARQNDKVMLAAQRLCGVLIASGATRVRFACPPDLDHKGIDDYYAAHGAAAMRALLAEATELEPADPKQPLMLVRKCAAYRDAPIDAKLRVPEGYELQRDGSLWSTEKRGTKVTASPLFITRLLVDHYSGEGRVELVYPQGEEWVTAVASHRAISDTRALVTECAPFGVPVNSANAGKLVEWFADYLHCNTTTLPRLASVAKAGWHTLDGARAFVTDEPIAADGVALFALDQRGDRRKTFAALAPRGTLDGHLAALRRAWDASPVAACAIAGALAAPLLEPLKAPNFAIHLLGESSRGKTTQLKVAGSVYGDPASPQWFASWNATLSGIELRASQLNDLPQCYDEIGGGDPQMAERIVYTLINGGGRTRATRDLAIRETVSWRTVVLSTGERELADETAATGAQVRVVQLPITGFGPLTAQDVDALGAECAAHAGSLGRAWVRELVAITDWPHYRSALKQLTAALREGADPLQSRVVGYFALLSLTEAMVSESFGLGRKDGGTLRELLGSIGSREHVQGIAERAREAVESWVMSEPDAFPELIIGAHGGLEEPKSNGVRTRHGFRKPDGTILILTGQFRQFCAKRARLTSRAVVREWQRLGWTECDSSRLDKQIRIGTARARYIVLTPLVSSDTNNTGAER